LGSAANMDYSDFNAAFYSDEHEKLYLLKGYQYIRHTFIVGENGRKDPGYPRSINNWDAIQQIPDFAHRIHAAFYVDSDKNLYLFKGHKYARIKFKVGGHTSLYDGYPRITRWEGLPEEFEDDLYAAFYSDKKKKLYLLGFWHYVRLTFDGDRDVRVDSGYPKSITSMSSDLAPLGFHADIDAAFYSDKYEKLYLLRGWHYVRLTFKVGQEGRVDSGYPRLISNWIS
jgi:hemopexin